MIELLAVCALCQRCTIESICVLIPVGTQGLRMVPTIIPCVINIAI